MSSDASNNVPFRVLALDGGGIRGLFSAAFLAHIERHTGKSLVNHFDLIVGTSTGAIIALGLAGGLSAAQILNFYKEDGPRIFSGGGRLRMFFRPKYDNKQLLESLQKVMGERTMNDLIGHVAIPSYDLVDGCPRVFKDDHHPALHWGGSHPVWKVAAASAAAPAYFPAFQITEGDSHIDGGIWANNPVLVGVTEAIRYFNQPLSNIAVLSVGTGSRAFRLRHEQSNRLGLLGWALGNKMLNVLFAAQSQSAHLTASLLLKPDNYIRVDADLTDPVPLDDYPRANHLIARGTAAGTRHKVAIESLFLSHPRAIIVPEQKPLDIQVGSR
jgi:patatin-like phospholipase/acyl hydrolase